MSVYSLSIMAKTLSVLGVLITLLSACQSTSESNSIENYSAIQKDTLADLAKEQLAFKVEHQLGLEDITTNNFIEMSKQQRSQKLASLYKNILTLEPNQEVRTKIEYRLVQIDTHAYDQFDGSLTQSDNNQELLASLVTSYQALLTRFPNRVENEEIQYQLAKALSLQGKLDESLLQIESLLTQYPNSIYAAELHFRRGDIYYNLQYYTKAFSAYQAVLNLKNNTEYYVNSVYMSGWTLFKLNRLPEADQTFLSLLDYIIAQEKNQLFQDSFSFSLLDNRNISLVDDIQRVISVSLSQQQQEKSLVALVDTHEKMQPIHNYLYLYRHVLFKNLVDFLLENDLKHDAELTYKAYLTLAPNNIWAARYSLSLIELYKQQGKHNAVRSLKTKYVQQFGLQSDFWQQEWKAGSADKASLMNEIFPNLLAFSYQHSRYLYAQAQSENIVSKRTIAFAETAQWLGLYLSLAKQPQAAHLVRKLKLSKGLLADEFLYADASYEAQQYQNALNSYEYIAYQAPITSQGHELQRKEAAYAATVTIRKMLTNKADRKLTAANINEIKPNSALNGNIEKTLLVTQSRLDKAFIEHYPNDERALALAVQQAQYAFDNTNPQMLQHYTNFVLQSYGVVSRESGNNQKSVQPINHSQLSAQLTLKARKEVQIATQLQANYLYQQGQYTQAEHGYNLALNYILPNNSFWLDIRELLAASIYFQGKKLMSSQPLLAVEHFLRLGKEIPESDYRLNAHFDAANLLLEQQEWQEAVHVLLDFQERYPVHQYSHSIPAKLVQAYEQLQQWQMAAVQYLAIVDLASSDSSELKREALYHAAELYLKANNLDKAISTFRTYAHQYPEPFDIAQEVRFKMSGFYQQTKEPNKQYYWYRKIIKFYEQQFSSLTEIAKPRDLYLASVAALGLGEAHQQTFNQNKLTLPLNKSLAQKQKAMTSAVSYYKKLLSFNLAEFVPQATFNLAQMYRQLSQDVLSSQQPHGLDELALEEYNLLLEDIAYPFEEKAIEIHTSNAQRAWQNTYDKWVKKSFSALAELAPALFDRNYKFSTADKRGLYVDAVRTLH